MLVRRLAVHIPVFVPEDEAQRARKVLPELIHASFADRWWHVHRNFVSNTCFVWETDIPEMVKAIAHYAAGYEAWKRAS